MALFSRQRTDHNSPLIKDFDPWPSLTSGLWLLDIFEEIAMKPPYMPEVIEPTRLVGGAPGAGGDPAVEAVFDQRYVRGLLGSAVKTGQNKHDLAMHSWKL